MWCGVCCVWFQVFKKVGIPSIRLQDGFTLMGQLGLRIIGLGLGLLTENQQFESYGSVQCHIYLICKYIYETSQVLSIIYGPCICFG